MIPAAIALAEETAPYWAPIVAAEASKRLGKIPQFKKLPAQVKKAITQTIQKTVTQKMKRNPRTKTEIRTRIKALSKFRNYPFAREEITQLRRQLAGKSFRNPRGKKNPITKAQAETFDKIIRSGHKAKWDTKKRMWVKGTKKNPLDKKERDKLITTILQPAYKAKSDALKRGDASEARYWTGRATAASEALRRFSQPIEWKNPYDKYGRHFDKFYTRYVPLPYGLGTRKVVTPISVGSRSSKEHRYKRSVQTRLNPSNLTEKSKIEKILLKYYLEKGHTLEMAKQMAKEDALHTSFAKNPKRGKKKTMKRKMPRAALLAMLRSKKTPEGLKKFWRKKLRGATTHGKKTTTKTRTRHARRTAKRTRTHSYRVKRTYVGYCSKCGAKIRMKGIEARCPRCKAIIRHPKWMRAGDTFKRHQKKK